MERFFQALMIVVFLWNGTHVAVLFLLGSIFELDKAT